MRRCCCIMSTSSQLTPPSPTHTHTRTHTLLLEAMQAPPVLAPASLARCQKCFGLAASLWTARCPSALTPEPAAMRGQQKWQQRRLPLPTAPSHLALWRPRWPTPQPVRQRGLHWRSPGTQSARSECTGKGAVPCRCTTWATPNARPPCPVCCRTQVGRRAVGEFRNYFDKDWLRTGLRK